MARNNTVFALAILGLALMLYACSGCIKRYVAQPGYRMESTREITETTVIESENPPALPGMRTY